MRPAGVSLLWLLAGALAAALLAQQGEVTDTVYVRLGLVDAIVADGKGRLLRDLTAEDFELKVDGTVAPIVHFEAPGSDAERATTERREAPDGEPVPAPHRPVDEVTVFLYLDDRNTPPHHRERVQQDLIESLIAAGLDRRVVVVQRQNRLQFSALLGSADEIRAHVEGLAAPPARSLMVLRAREAATAQLAKSHEDCLAVVGCEPCDSNWGQLLSLANGYAADEETRTADAVAALAEVAAVAAGVEGQKVLLWVSSGISQRPAIEAFDYIGDICEPYRPDARSAVLREILLYDESPRLLHLAAHANARRVTIVALDAAGLRAGLSSSVSFASLAVRPTTHNDSVFASNLQSTLALLARETGGRAITNANRPGELLGRALEQVADGYVLGFSLEGPPSGREHLISVKLRGRRLRAAQVRYRRSLQDRALEQTLLDRLAATLYTGEGENPLRASVSAGEEVDTGRRFQEVAIVVAVPKAALRELGADASRLRVWLTASSDSGWRSKTRQEIFDPAQEEGDILRFAVRMELPKEPVRVAVGIREETTGATSRLLLEVASDEDG